MIWYKRDAAVFVTMQTVQLRDDQSVNQFEYWIYFLILFVLWSGGTKTEYIHSCAIRNYTLWSARIPLNYSLEGDIVLFIVLHLCDVQIQIHTKQNQLINAEAYYGISSKSVNVKSM